MNLLLEGDDLEALLIRARREGGPFARIVRAEKVRRGGVMGFFAKEAFEVAVEVPGGIEDDEELALPAPVKPAPPERSGARDLLALAQQAAARAGREAGGEESLEQTAALAMARQAAFEAAMASDERAPIQDLPSRRGPSFDPYGQYGQNEVRETLDLAEILGAGGYPGVRAAVSPKIVSELPLPRLVRPAAPESLAYDEAEWEEDWEDEYAQSPELVALEASSDAVSDTASDAATLEAEEQEAARRAAEEAAEREARIAARAEEIRAERAAKAARAAKTKAAKAARAAARKRAAEAKAASVVETASVVEMVDALEVADAVAPVEAVVVEDPADEVTIAEPAEADLAADSVTDAVASGHGRSKGWGWGRGRKGAHVAPDDSAPNDLSIVTHEVPDTAPAQLDLPVSNRIEIPEAPGPESDATDVTHSEAEELDFSRLRPAWTRSRGARPAEHKRSLTADLGLPASKGKPRPAGSLMTESLPGIRVEMSSAPPSGGRPPQGGGSLPLNTGGVPSDSSTVRDIPKLLPLPPKARSGGSGRGPGGAPSEPPKDEPASPDQEGTELSAQNVPAQAEFAGSGAPLPAPVSAGLQGTPVDEADLIAKWADPTGPTATPNDIPEQRTPESAPSFGTPALQDAVSPWTTTSGAAETAWDAPLAPSSSSEPVWATSGTETPTEAAPFGVPAQSPAPLSEASAPSDAPQFGMPATADAPQFGAPAQSDVPQFGAAPQGDASSFGATPQGDASSFGATTQGDASAFSATTQDEAPRFGVPAQGDAASFGAPAVSDAPQFGVPAQTETPQFEIPRLAPVTAPTPAVQAFAPVQPAEPAQPLPPPADAGVPSGGAGFGQSDAFTQTTRTAEAPSPAEPTVESVTAAWAAPLPGQGDTTITSPWAVMPSASAPTTTPESPQAPAATPIGGWAESAATTAPTMGDGDVQAQQWAAPPSFGASAGADAMTSAPTTETTPGLSTQPADRADLGDLPATAARATTVLPKGKARRSKKNAPAPRPDEVVSPAAQTAVPVPPPVPAPAQSAENASSAGPDNDAQTGDDSGRHRPRRDRSHARHTGPGTDPTLGSPAGATPPAPLSAARAEAEAPAESGFKLFGIRFGGKKNKKTKDESVAPVTPLKTSTDSAANSAAENDDERDPSLPPIEASSLAAAGEPPAWEIMAARASSAAAAGELAAAQAVLTATESGMGKDGEQTHAQPTVPAQPGAPASESTAKENTTPANTENTVAENTVAGSAVADSAVSEGASAADQAAADVSALWATPSTASETTTDAASETTPSWASPADLMASWAVPAAPAEADKAPESQPVTAWAFQPDPVPAAETPPASEDTNPASAIPGTDSPAVHAPATESPALKAPATGEPALQAPATETPTFQTPAVQTSAFETLATEEAAVQAPATETSAFQAPAIEGPTFHTPEAEAPALQTPAAENTAFQAPATETPTFQAPALGFPAFGTTDAETSPSLPTGESLPGELPPFQATMPGKSTAATENEAPAPEAPTFVEPAFETPAFGASDFEAPAFEAPAFEAPAPGAPAFGEPALPVPGLESPFETSTINPVDEPEITWATDFTAGPAPALGAEALPPLPTPAPAIGAATGFPVTESPFTPTPEPQAPTSSGSEGTETGSESVDFGHPVNFENVRAGVQAGLETAEEIAAGLALTTDKLALSSLGVPTEWLATLQPGDRFMAIVQMLGAMPEPAIADDVEVIAVVGPPDVVGLEAARTALDLPHNGGPRTIVTVPSEVGPERNGAIDLAVATRPVVVSVPVDGDGAEAAGKVRKVLQNVQAEAVIAVIDATRSLEENQRWVRYLGKVDAVALDGAMDSSEPAAVMQLGLPVVRLDGIGVDRVGWAALLCTQLAVGGATS